MSISPIKVRALSKASNISTDRKIAIMSPNPKRNFCLSNFLPLCVLSCVVQGSPRAGSGFSKKKIRSPLRNKGEQGRNIYAKSESLTFICRVIWVRPENVICTVDK